MGGWVCKSLGMEVGVGVGGGGAELDQIPPDVPLVFLHHRRHSR